MCQGNNGTILGAEDRKREILLPGRKEATARFQFVGIGEVKFLPLRRDIQLFNLSVEG